MILQALKEYYDRKVADPESEIAPEGFEKKELQFLIVINEKGQFINIEDTREKIGNKLIAKSFLLPRSKKRSGSRSYETTFLLWDHIGYLLGQPADDEKSSKQHQAWLDSLKKLPRELVKDTGVNAILQFYKNSGVAKAIATPEIQECFKAPQCNMSFRLISDIPVPCRKKVREFVMNTVKSIEEDGEESAHSVKIGTCLVTGEIGEIARTHGNTPIDKDTKCFVGFQKKCGYDSYGKEQGYNAPIIKSTEFAYVTALNTLLKSGRQHFSVGDGTYVCWSADKTNFETVFSMFFDDSQARDNPDLFSNNVKALFKSIDSEAFIQSEETQRFYLLGLSPGGGTRISVRFWDAKTIAEYAVNIHQYFDELSIVKPTKYPEYFSIWRLLVNIAQQGDQNNIPPQLAGEMVRAIICGLLYPAALLQAAIRRTHAGIKKRAKGGGESIERVTPEIAAIIKAYLNRFYRFHPNRNHKEVTMELDTSQPSIGYQLGRLFAVLEKIQEEANPGINATIRERFYGAACATPVTVFANLLRLKNHHLAKLDNKGRVVNFEKLLAEIICRMNDFPAHLDLHEQGRFAIGYYHQRQAFFITREVNESELSQAKA